MGGDESDDVLVQRSDGKTKRHETTKTDVTSASSPSSSHQMELLKRSTPDIHCVREREREEEEEEERGERTRTRGERKV